MTTPGVSPDVFRPCVLVFASRAASLTDLFGCVLKLGAVCGRAIFDVASNIRAVDLATDADLVLANTFARAHIVCGGMAAAHGKAIAVWVEYDPMDDWLLDQLELSQSVEE